MNKIRPEPEYFRVGYYGLGFPSFLQVSSVMLEQRHIFIVLYYVYFLFVFNIYNLYKFS